MPGKTMHSRSVALSMNIRFNEAPAKCRGKPPAPGAQPGKYALLQ